MLHLLFPLGLLASLGIIIPVLIHLWNIKSGKTLKIGSVFLLGTPSNQRSRSLKVKDWPLLLLRCLLIILIAFILAQPVYRKALKATDEMGWILIEKAQFSKIWNQEHKMLDSLVRKGYEVHDFDVNFAKLDMKDTLTSFSRPDKPEISYFSLIRQLEGQHPAGTTMYLFAEQKLKNFKGQQPQTNLNLHWKFLPADSSKATWLAGAHELQNGGVKKTTAYAEKMGTYYKVEEIDEMAAAGMKVDTSNLLIQIYADKNAADATYVSAAVLAAADYMKRKIVLKRISSAKEIRDDADLVFWLSDRALSSSELAQVPEKTTLFSYAGQKMEKVSSTIEDLSGIALKPAGLYRRTINADTTGVDVWSDATGTAVLNRTSVNGVSHYQFYSRFRPEWTNMVWSEQMILFVLPITLPETAAATGFQDKGKLFVAADEINTTGVKQIAEKQENKFSEQSLSPWLWWILLLLFFAERLISYRTKAVTL